MIPPLSMLLNPRQNARVAALNQANAEGMGTDTPPPVNAVSVAPVDASTNVSNSKSYNFASANPARPDDPTISSQLQVLMRFA